MNIQADHFSLFGLQPRFAIDAAALDGAYRELQARVHPDRHAASGAADQRVALQWATQANEAYRVLRDPLKRATYLCVLGGQDPADEHNTSMPQDFLMQQLAWREALDDAMGAGDREALDPLAHELDARRADLAAQVGVALDGEPRSVDSAAGLVRQWMFVERFGDDVADARDRLAVVAA